MEAKDRLHLIGSVPLDNSEQVFRRLSDELGPFLRCMPDGETGERSRWVYFQRQMLLAHPAMEIDPTVPPYKFVQWDGKVVREIEQLRFKPGVDPVTVQVRDRLRQGRTRLLGSLQEAARRRRHPPARPLPGLPADATGQRLPLCQRRGPRDLFRRLRARAEDGARPHRAGRSRQRTSRSSGTSARRCWPSRTISRIARPTARSRPSTCWGAWVMPCRKAWKWAITSATARRATSIWCSPRIPPFWSR